MMRLHARVQVAQAQGWTMLVLPFQDERSALHLFLPPVLTGDQKLSLQPSPEIRAALLAAASKKDVDLRLPRLKLTGENLELKQKLPNLFGKPLAHLLKNASLPISKVVHQANVEWDEAGAEAAAATAVVGVRSSLFVDETLELRFDRPFAFFIQEQQNVLFSAQIYHLP